MNPPQKMYRAVFHCVNSSSAEGPEDLSFFDPHVDYIIFQCKN